LSNKEGENGMAAIALASTRNMTKEQWLEYRKLGIGGSDVSAIAGMNRWKSPIEVWMEKTGQLESKELGEAAYWGTMLEDVVAREYAKRSGLRVQKRNAILQHPKHTFMLANVDRIIHDKDRGRGILECKTTNEYKKGEWEEEKIPEEYAIQVHHYLAVTGLQFARIAVLIGGNKFEIKDIERDEEIIDHLVKIESDFWQLVQSNTPPEMDGSSSSTELLKYLYPNSNQSSIELPEAGSMVEEFLMLQEMEKTIGTKKDAVANKIKQMMGENENAYTLTHKIGWKSLITNRFDTNGFKAAHKDLYKEFVNETPSRRFTIGEIKKLK
jgi:putative phage-type endonuclease